MILARRTILGAAAAFGASFASRATLAASASSVFTLQHPDGRETLYRVMAPTQPRHWGVVLFSHGANSSNTDYDRFWTPWAQAGYLVIGPNHIDTGPPATQRKVSRGELWSSRLADTTLPLDRRSVFDDLARARGASLDWTRLAAAGHSFGAVVAQSLAGATLIAPGASQPAAHPIPGVSACVALSPPGPLPDFIPAQAWSTVRVPSLLQTGDADILPGFVDDWRSRLIGFSPAEDRWTVLCKGVDHVFHGLICSLSSAPSADLPALLETADITTLFLQAYIRNDATALRSLHTRATQGEDALLTLSQG